MKELFVGDLAPAVAFSEFLKGEPLSALVRGTIYVIEFWASWCVPCIHSMPDLTRLQAAHPEIVVIGVVAHEKNPEKMRALVARKGDDIGYRIALQAPSPLPAIGNDPGQMTHDWLEGSYSDGIPQSFLVDGAGRVAWIGPPVLLEEQLTALLAGKLDIDSSARDYRKKAEDSLRKQRYELMRAFDVARQTKNKTDFFRACDETIAAHPQIEKFIGPWKLRLIMGDGVSAKEEALAYARAFSDGVAHDDVETLVRIAWTLIEERIDGEARTRSSAIPDYARLGVEILERAETIDKFAAPASAFWLNSTLARGHAFAGRCDAALQRLERARANAKDAGMSKQTMAQLDEVELMCREPSQRQ
ncbi:hypothetical+protein [Methylocapsa aurea]|uniref:TlpA family protein disulfide reductase n=1 Tax=Methylocapsa aurea TaxID=663610 RepID=UPI003D18E1A2